MRSFAEIIVFAGLVVSCLDSHKLGQLVTKNSTIVICDSIIRIVESTAFTGKIDDFLKASLGISDVNGLSSGR